MEENKLDKLLSELKGLADKDPSTSHINEKMDIYSNLLDKLEKFVSTVREEMVVACLAELTDAVRLREDKEKQKEDILPPSDVFL